MRLFALLGVACTACASLPSHPAPPLEGPAPFVVDTHVHLTMAHAAIPIFWGEPGDGHLTHTTWSSLTNQVDGPMLNAAGMRTVYGALWVPLPLRPGRREFEETLHQILALEEFAARRPEFAITTTVAEARRAMAIGRIAVFPQVEGGEGITSVEDVDRLYAMGVRCITVVHFVDTQLGGAAQGQLAKNLLGVAPTGRNPQGLTPLGRAVITRMAELGIVIDLAHASDHTMEDVLSITEPRGVPVIVSHTGARQLMDMERNVSDDLARRVVASGGLIGVAIFPKQTETPVEAQLPDHQVGTCDDVVAHFKHFAALVGPEALVIGTDMNGLISRPRPGGLCPDGVPNSGGLPELWAALAAQGVPRGALDGMGDTFLKLVAKVESKADPHAQADALRLRHALLRARSTLFDAVEPSHP